MTENTSPMPAGEEPGSAENAEVQLPTVDELSSVTDEATQITPIETAPIAPEAGQAIAEAVPTPSEATPAPAYDQFGASTEAVQPNLEPITPMLAQPQVGDPTAFYSQYAAQPGQPLPAQGSYAQYHGQPVPAAPAVKKRRVALWVALIVVALVLVGGGTAAFALASNHARPQPAQAKVQVPAPNETLQMYCQDVMSNNAQGLYDLLSQQAKVHTSLDDLQQKFDAITQASNLGLNMQYTACTFSNLRVSGSLAVATISLTTTMTMQVQGQSQTISSTAPDLVSLVLEGNQWKIDFSSLAQPQPKVDLPNLTLPTPTPSN